MCLQEDGPPPPNTPRTIPVLLDTNLSLPDGTRVRLRLPHARDRAGALALLTRLGLAADELDVHRTLRFDPRLRAVVCATVWSAAGESVVGLGGMTYATGQVDLLLTDEELAPGLEAELRALLASAHARHAAA
jgi:hypothetical protein